MTDLLILIAVAAVAGAVGIWLGIVVLARPIGRALERADHDAGSSTPEDASGGSHHD